MKDYDLYRIRKVMTLLSHYERSDECYCERMRKTPTRYGKPPCLKCQSNEWLEKTEDFLLMKIGEHEDIIIEDEEPDVPYYHGRGVR